MVILSANVCQGKAATTQDIEFESNMITTDWPDLNGDQPAPQIMKNVTVKQYTDLSVSKVLVSSPDYSEGITKAVNFTVGNDGGGRYITFTVPHLEYWTMCELVAS